MSQGHVVISGAEILLVDHVDAADDVKVLSQSVRVSAVLASHGSVCHNYDGKIRQIASCYLLQQKRHESLLSLLARKILLY